MSDVLKKITYLKGDYSGPQILKFMNTCSIFDSFHKYSVIEFKVFGSLLQDALKHSDQTEEELRTLFNDYIRNISRMKIQGIDVTLHNYNAFLIKTKLKEIQ